jgi:CheY-like chemotaxis protein/HPt (histidine-containing phosphotransfer) domain-containing protein
MTTLHAPLLAGDRAAPVANGSVPVPQRNLHILLAEDNEINQRLAVATLEKWGHTVVVANNGKEALDALEEQVFDLVLMDVQMPEMDGFEATVAIREGEEVTGRHIPIIAMTAHVMEGDRERCLEAGMDGYTSKPIKAEVLFQAIEDILPASTEAVVGAIEEQSADGILDMSELLERAGDDMELVMVVVDMFLDEYPELLSQMQDAIQRGDSEALRIAAHTLKGSSANLAARSVSQAALVLEDIGRDGDMTHAEEAYSALEAEMERLKPVLTSLGKERQK